MPLPVNIGRGPDLVKLLRSKDTWEEVLQDDVLVKKCLSSYSSVRSTFDDLQAAKKLSCFVSRLLSYMDAHPGKPYTPSELKERSFPCYWLILNLLKARFLRQKHILIIGRPNTVTFCSNSTRKISHRI